MIFFNQLSLDQEEITTSKGQESRTDVFELL